MIRRARTFLLNRRWVFAVGIVVLAFALTYATILFARDDGRIASIWPLNAVMLAILMRWPRRFWGVSLAALASGHFGANLVLGDDIVRAGLLTSANVIEVALSARLLVGTYTVRLTRRSGFFRFFLAVLLSCLVSTCIATIALVFRGGNPPVEGALLWFAAHGLSLLVFTPPLSIAFAGQIRPLFRREALARTLIILLAASAVTIATFVQSAFPLLFMTPVLIVLVAFQLGLAGATLMALIVAVISVPLTFSGRGPIVLIDGGLSIHILFLQAFLVLMSTTALLVGGSVAERRTMLSRLLSARKRAQRKSIAEGELLDQARMSESISNVGYWTMVPSTGAVFWSPQVYRIHGVEPPFDPALENALSFYVPADRAMIEAMITEKMASGDGWAFDATLVRRSDGDLRNVQSVATCLRDKNGEVVKMFGVFKDLTDERRLAATSAENESRYRLLAENATDVVAIYDMQGVFSYLSPSIYDMLGYHPDELVGRRSYEIMPPDEAKRVAGKFAEALPEIRNFSVEYCAIRKDGTRRWLEARPRPQYDPDGNMIGFVDNVRDVTDRREREAALAEARHVAEAATSSKATFLANMSHEIRTPLNGVLGFAGLLSETDLNEEQARYVQRIRSAGEGLAVLINDILDVSRIEAGKLSIDVRAFDLRAMAEDVVDLVAAGTKDKPIAYSVFVSPDLAKCVLGDDARIRQVLMNVVGNAAKFTSAGTVGLAITVDGPMLSMRISDTGPGVSQDQLLTLFESFTQADGSITRQFGGSGLGLTISRSLAELMDGDLMMTSALGIGSTVTFTLPYRPVAGDHVIIATPRFDDIPLPSAGKPLAIMVVDDVEMNRELVQIALSREGHTITALSSGQAAIDTLTEGGVFDLILMDVQMPVMDGLTATRAIRNLTGVAGATPIIGLTANALPEQVEACLDAGMDDHIAKPVNRRLLVERVAAIVDGRHPRRPLPPQEPSAAEDPMAALSRRYAAHLLTLPTEIDRLCGLSFSERAEGLVNLAHAVAGTAGSLGFATLSTAAFDLERRAKQAVAGDLAPPMLDAAAQTFREALIADVAIGG